MQKSKITKALKKVDIFAKPVELLIKKEEGHSTIAGAILTLGIFALLGVLLFDQLSTLFNRDNPSSFYNAIYTDEPELIHLMGHNFTVQFDFEDANFIHYINTSIYQVTASMVHKYSLTDQTGATTVNFESEPLPIKICTIDNYLQKDLAAYFIAFDPSKQYCIDWSKIDYIPLKGQFSNTEFRYVEFQLSLCADSTCPDLDYVKEYTKSNYFSLQVSSTNVDLKDPYDPHKIATKDTFTTVSSQFFKQLDIYFKYVITETDFGLFGSDIVQKKDLAFSRTEERILLSNQNLIMSVLFRLDNIQVYNFRQYAKIQEIFGQIGGIWQVLCTVTLFLFTPIRNLSYKIQIINSLFNFDQQNQQDNSLNKQKMVDIFNPPVASARSSHSNNKSSLKKIQTQAFGSNQSIVLQMRSMKEISKGLKEYFSNSKKKLRLYKSEYIIFCCHCDKNPFKDKARTKIIQDQISYSSTRISKSLDILYLIKKLNEIDKLKLLLLNRDQLNLFDYLPKPTIATNPYSVENLSEHHKYFSILKKEKSDYQSTLDAQKSYKKIKNNLRDPINSKLVEFMGQQIQDLFDFDQNDEIIDQQLSENYDEDVDEVNPERIYNHSIQVLSPMNQTDTSKLRKI